MDLSNFVEKAKELNVLGVKVSQNGELIGEWYSEPECRRNVYSATKSFTSCAVGFAVQEGLLSLDEKLTEAFAEDLPKEVDENLKKATVRDLLTMCLGQKEGSLMGEQRPLYAEDDWVKLSLSLPFVYEPGTHFVYNNVGPYLADGQVKPIIDSTFPLEQVKEAHEYMEANKNNGKIILTIQS